MTRQYKQDEIKPDERPISELYRIVALEWVDVEAAAHLQERLKTTTLETWKVEVIAEGAANKKTIADNAAERIVKAQPRWREYIVTMCENRKLANRAKAKMEYYKMRYGEWNSIEANQRHEARLSRG